MWPVINTPRTPFSAKYRQHGKPRAKINRNNCKGVIGVDAAISQNANRSSWADKNKSTPMRTIVPRFINALIWALIFSNRWPLFPLFSMVFLFLLGFMMILLIICWELNLLDGGRGGWSVQQRFSDKGVVISKFIVNQGVLKIKKNILTVS